MTAESFTWRPRSVHQWPLRPHPLPQALELELDSYAGLVREMVLVTHLTSASPPQALELELDSYAGLVREMSSVGDAMVRASHPDAKMIQQRQQLINQQLKVRCGRRGHGERTP